MCFVKHNCVITCMIILTIIIQMLNRMFIWTNFHSGGVYCPVPWCTGMSLECLPALIKLNMSLFLQEDTAVLAAYYDSLSLRVCKQRCCCRTLSTKMCFTCWCFRTLSTLHVDECSSASSRQYLDVSKKGLIVYLEKSHDDPRTPSKKYQVYCSLLTDK